MAVVRLDTRSITDWETFHDLFAAAFGFPDFYGRNMNAWIDYLSDLDELKGLMTVVHVDTGGVAVIYLEHAADFATRCPEQYAAIIECSAFVNWRRVEHGMPAVLALAFRKEA